MPHETYPRSLAREIAFLYLYQQELNPGGHLLGVDLPEVRDEDEEVEDDWRLGPQLPPAPPALTRARLIGFARGAFAMIYREEADGEFRAGVDDALLEQWFADNERVAFALSLIRGVQRHRAALDEALAAAARHWSLERMSATDRTILRIGAFEIRHAATPDTVAVDEAIELAKRFGSAQSGQFVNGILDHLMPAGKHAGDPPPAEPPTPDAPA